MTGVCDSADQAAAGPAHGWPICFSDTAVGGPPGFNAALHTCTHLYVGCLQPLLLGALWFSGRASLLLTLPCLWPISSPWPPEELLQAPPHPATAALLSLSHGVPPASASPGASPSRALPRRGLELVAAEPPARLPAALARLFARLGRNPCHRDRGRVRLLQLPLPDSSRTMMSSLRNRLAVAQECRRGDGAMGCSIASATAGSCATALLRSWLSTLSLGAALAAAAALCAPVGAELQAAPQTASSPSGTAVSSINLLITTSMPEDAPILLHSKSLLVSRACVSSNTI